MSQTYIHACERAELLGLPIPTEEEWKYVEKGEAQDHATDNDDAVIQNLDSSTEAAQQISHGLDELNSILNATQKKFNRFKTVCGSLGTLLKIKVGTKNATPDHKFTEQNHNETKNVNSETKGEKLIVELSDDNKHMENRETNRAVPKRIDINEKLGSHLDKLDLLITKAENAQYSMQHQTKQMQKMLK